MISGRMGVFALFSRLLVQKAWLVGPAISYCEVKNAVGRGFLVRGFRGQPIDGGIRKVRHGKGAVGPRYVGLCCVGPWIPGSDGRWILAVEMGRC